MDVIGWRNISKTPKKRDRASRNHKCRQMHRKPTLLYPNLTHKSLPAITFMVVDQIILSMTRHLIYAYGTILSWGGRTQSRRICDVVSH